jgi:hypothetical protein
MQLFSMLHNKGTTLVFDYFARVQEGAWFESNMSGIQLIF